MFKSLKDVLAFRIYKKFAAVQSSHLANTLSLSPFVMTPMSVAFEVVLKHLSAGVMKCIGVHLIQFIKNYKQNSNLLCHDIWDEHFRNVMSAELQLYYLKRNSIFKHTKLIEGYNTCFSRFSNWELATCIDTKYPIIRK